jgi:ABC-2 type transport system permease protein
MAIRTAGADRISPAAPASELAAVANAIYTLWYRGLVRIFRDRSRIVDSPVQPLLFLLGFGSGLSPSMGRMGGSQLDLNYLQFIFPGIVAIAILFSAIFGAVSIS